MPRKKRKARIMRAKIAPSKAANVLALIAVFFLALNGILAVTLSGWIIQKIQENMANVTISKAALVTYGIVWLILSGIALITNNNIKSMIKQNRLDDTSWMWFLLVVSVVTIFVGRLESGALLLIASIIYLTKARKAKKK